MDVYADVIVMKEELSKLKKRVGKLELARKEPTDDEALELWTSHDRDELINAEIIERNRAEKAEASLAEANRRVEELEALVAKSVQQTADAQEELRLFKIQSQLPKGLNDCVTCKHEKLDANDFPCSACPQAWYHNSAGKFLRWEPKE